MSECRAKDWASQPIYGQRRRLRCGSRSGNAASRRWTRKQNACAGRNPRRLARLPRTRATRSAQTLTLLRAGAPSHHGGASWDARQSAATQQRVYIARAASLGATRWLGELRSGFWRCGAGSLPGPKWPSGRPAKIDRPAREVAGGEPDQVARAESVRSIHVPANYNFAGGVVYVISIGGTARDSRRQPQQGDSSAVRAEGEFHHTAGLRLMRRSWPVVETSIPTAFGNQTQRL
jgi:hypothetical protein